MIDKQIQPQLTMTTCCTLADCTHETNNEEQKIKNAKRGEFVFDYSKITLCPASEYKCYCQVGGCCDYCPHFHTRKDENCKGCGANFKNKKLNVKSKFIKL